MENTSCIKISESALQHNFSYLRSRLKKSCQLSHVVKGNAYGHGFDEFVPLAVKNGARHFSVFDAYEAERIYNCVDTPITIMIMGMVEDEQLEWVIEHEIEFFVFEMYRLRKTVAAARKVGVKARIHIELETGMNRTGLEEELWEKAAQYYEENKNFLTLCGFCTHFAGAESISNHIRIRKQHQNFKKGVQRFEKWGLKAKQLHTACSAAVMRLPQTHHDLVRMGILQYGLWPSQETYIATAGAGENPQDPLKRLLTWESRVMSTKKVKKGEYIGYGTSFLASQTMRIATVPVGYSHGFSRSLSNSGRALVRGERVSVIGLVNMNAMILDVTHLDNVETGDKVVLIGEQNGHSISVASFSDYSSQLNYELLTRLPQDIPRFIVK